jgi:hypothetical protein
MFKSITFEGTRLTLAGVLVNSSRLHPQWFHPLCPLLLLRHHYAQHRKSSEPLPGLQEIHLPSTRHVYVDSASTDVKHVPVETMTWALLPARHLPMVAFFFGSRGRYI